MEGMAAGQTDRSRASALVGPKSGLGARRTSRARPGSDSLGVFRGTPPACLLTWLAMFQASSRKTAPLTARRRERSLVVPPSTGYRPALAALLPENACLLCLVEVDVRPRLAHGHRSLCLAAAAA